MAAMTCRMCLACVEPPVRPLRLITAWMLLGLTLLLTGCGREAGSPEDRVREVIVAMETAIEAGSLKEASAWLGADYSDSHHPDRRSAVRTLLGYLYRHKHIHLFTRIQQIDIDPGGTRAKAAVLVAMTGQPIDDPERLLALKAGLYRFELDFTLDQNEDAWLINHSRWQRADLGVLMP